MGKSPPRWSFSTARASRRTISPESPSIAATWSRSDPSARRIESADAARSRSVVASVIHVASRCPRAAAERGRGRELDPLPPVAGGAPLGRRSEVVSIKDDSHSLRRGRQTVHEEPLYRGGVGAKPHEQTRHVLRRSRDYRAGRFLVKTEPIEPEQEIDAGLVGRDEGWPPRWSSGLFVEIVRLPLVAVVRLELGLVALAGDVAEQM